MNISSQFVACQLSYGSFVDVLYLVKKLCSGPSLLSVFIIKECWILSNVFYIY